MSAAERIKEALQPVAPERWASLDSMPAEVLANRVVSSLIMAKGNLNEYARVIEALIINMRTELRPDRASTLDADLARKLRAANPVEMLQAADEVATMIERGVLVRAPHPDDLHLIWFEDAAMRPEVFYGAGAQRGAHARLKQCRQNWTCHLLVHACPPDLRELERDETVHAPSAEGQT